MHQRQQLAEFRQMATEAQEERQNMREDITYLIGAFEDLSAPFPPPQEWWSQAHDLKWAFVSFFFVLRQFVLVLTIFGFFCLEFSFLKPCYFLQISGLPPATGAARAAARWPSSGKVLTRRSDRWMATNDRCPIKVSSVIFWIFAPSGPHEKFQGIFIAF